ncbi:MAG: ribosome maturation factor RimP [Eubacterium sp.]|nr:ribosome maturation factor RimP [Eubacterium sp.]
MSRREEYESKTEALLIPILEEKGYEMVDVEYVKEGSNWYLRAYIDKPGGITINDLESVSRRLSDLLDEKDFISDAYILEVSSPGLGRPLKKDRDFDRSIGEEIEVHLYRSLNGNKQYVGLLKSYDKDTITIEDEDGSEINLDRVNVSLVKLTIDF